ncbi:mediator of RNA polymerase II transcription subunit 24-like [Ctenocephalides felis]|uniref:mediator of RNA polymerase II transcription subunit 24-like n=1 Tax=Ctenocephalides felis TaxID=7515 RepID=UPI000E6E31F9|nr:mediator of RNA polymerase II transcription subunit 24-like [Ctenocephalides felis]
MTLENSKTTSKTSSLKALLLRAWKDRWTDLQWGINIKTILPRGVSGDVYNLADCMLQHAVIGAGANQLVLSYLHHTLSCQMVSYAAVLIKISKFDEFEKPHCLISLLEFLETIQPGITCRNKAEEDLLASAILSIVHWLLQIYHYTLCSFVIPTSQDSTQTKIEFPELLDKPTKILEAFVSCDFIMALMYLAKHDDEDLHLKIIKKCNEINSMITLAELDRSIQDSLQKLCNLDAVSKLIEPDEPVTYCIQALLTVDVVVNPCADTQTYVNQLLMIQSFKGYSNPRLYCELIRACLISLHDVNDAARESMWGAFTFLKVPEIIERLNNPYKDKKDYSQDVVSAFELLLQYTSLLDLMDTKSSCNIIEYVLGGMLKHRLVNESHVKTFAAMRAPRSEILIKLDTSKTLSIPTMITRAEPTLAGILKTLSVGCDTLADALLCMLCQVLTGKSFELILAVATVQGTLKQFVSELIKCNESSKELCDEVGKNAQTKMLLFDVSFLMLCSIVQTYGSENVLDINGDSFFEEWVRTCMVERFKPKSPDRMVARCDHATVETLLVQFNSGESDFKNSQISWSKACMHIGAVVQEVLRAWEQGSLSPADVKRILDALRSKACSLAACAAAWLCAHMRVAHQDALLKPMNMVQQLLNPVAVNPGTDAANSSASGDESNGGSSSILQSGGEHFKERSGLMFQIVRKMQYDVHPTTLSKSKVLNVSHSIVSPKPIYEQLQTVWADVQNRGWLNVEATLTLESLLNTGGSSWFVTSLVGLVLEQQRSHDSLIRAVDTAFAAFSLSSESCAVALLEDVLPRALRSEKRAEEALTEPGAGALAALTARCVLACLSAQDHSTTASLKRSRSDAFGDESPSESKSRRLNDNVNGACTTAAELALNASIFPQTLGDGSRTPEPQKSPLITALKALFEILEKLATDKVSTTRQTYFAMQLLRKLVTSPMKGKGSRELLRTLPDQLVPALVRALPEMFSTALILRLYDIDTPAGRSATARDLCLLRNMQLRARDPTYGSNTTT